MLEICSIARSRSTRIELCSKKVCSSFARLESCSKFYCSKCFLIENDRLEMLEHLKFLLVHIPICTYGRY